jgi:hypothetical protein
MIARLVDKLAQSRHRDVLLTAAGMGALLFGRKVSALSMFGAGVVGLEREWRRRHPEFHGSWGERWHMAASFYEQTHRDPVNRWLHIAGIPLIVGGTVGLLACKPFRPTWAVSAGAFAVGWGLNFVGHGFFEKAAPAFRDDPLSFVAGPVWDLTQLRSRFGGAHPASSSDANGHARGEWAEAPPASQVPS